MRRIVAAVMVLALTACRERRATPRYSLGRPAAASDIAQGDIDVGADGAGLPAGLGSVADGEAIYARKCATCHGDRGEGKRPLYPALVGRDTIAEGFRFANTPGLPRTIGNYWPYATTVFDYVRRAMPQPEPGSLTNDEVYAITAYLLAANNVIASDATLDSASLARVVMPYAKRFVRDDRRGGREVK